MVVAFGMREIGKIENYLQLLTLGPGRGHRLGWAWSLVEWDPLMIGDSQGLSRWRCDP